MFPQLPASVRVFVCTRATDMRKSFDGLLGLVRELLSQDPLSGHLLMLPSLSPFLGARCLAPLWGSLTLGAERCRQLNGSGLTPV